MPQEGKPDYLALRVLDNNTGAEVVRDLFHLHQTTWQVRALQQGMPGSSTLGTFRILLPPPYSEEGKRYRSDFLKLALKQRVEGYLGGTITGSPRFSGIITGLHRPLDGPWEVTGVDSLWMLQQSQMLPGEIFAAPGSGVPPTNGREIVKALSGTQEVVWDDDFTKGAAFFGANYNNGPGGNGWAINAADPVFGLPCISSNFDGSFLITDTTWGASAQFFFSSVTAHGVCVANAGTDSTHYVNPGIFLLSDSTGANGALVELRMQQTGASTGLYNVSVAILSISGGVFTQQALASNLFTNIRPTFTFELAGVLYENAGKQEIRALLNGKDSGLAFNPGGVFPASGAVGVRSGVGSTGTTYMNRLQFHARNGPSLGTTWGTPRFGAGTQNLGSGSISKEIATSGQSHLDMMVVAATLDGFQIRKNPGFGYKADTLDYTASPGTDLSASVVLEEGVSILANGTAVATVPEMLGTDVAMKAIPGTDSGGSVTWGRIGAIGDAVLTDTVADMGIPGFTLLVNYARQVQGRKDNPLQAYQVRVIRTADWLGINNGAGPRELDFVLVHIPTLGVFRQKLQIMGYDFLEGSAELMIYLNQLPEEAAPLHQIQRIQRPLDYLSTTYQSR